MDGMNGLLDFAKTPEGQGLLAAVAGGLAGARRGTPINNIGRAGLAGVTGYDTALKTQGAQELRDLQVKKLIADQAQSTRKQQAIDNYKATLPAENRPLFDIAPDKMIENLPQFQKPQLVEVADPKDPLRTMKVWMRPGDAQGTTAGYGKSPEILDPRVQAAKQKIAAAGKSSTPTPTPYFQFLPTPDGYVAGNARTGMVAPVSVNGAPVVRSSDSPTLQGNIAGEKAKKQVMGKSSGETISELSGAESSMPQLEKTVTQLSDLGKKATYTYAGQARDAAVRQLGMGATDGAIAREKYTQTVRDVLFPQLRATFGAQFTVKEGEALIATLGDPNKSPEEKDAALNAYIDQKKQHLETLRRKTGGSNSAPSTNNNATGGVIDFGSLP